MTKGQKECRCCTRGQILFHISLHVSSEDRDKRNHKEVNTWGSIALANRDSCYGGFSVEVRSYAAKSCKSF